MDKKILLILLSLLVIFGGGVVFSRWLYIRWHIPFDVAVPGDEQMIWAFLEIDPATVKLNANDDWITVYIEFSEREWFPDADVTKIDIDTVTLNIYPEQNNKVSAENKPDYDFVTDPALYITDHDGDGKLERMVKFDLAKVQDILYIGDGIPIEVTGSLDDGTPFYGLTWVKARGRFWLF
jgi:hypothetical protein